MDRTTKILLFTIAFGLWANLAAQVWVVEAQNIDLLNIERYLRNIANGTCTNSKIC